MPQFRINFSKPMADAQSESKLLPAYTQARVVCLSPACPCRASVCTPWEQPLHVQLSRPGPRAHVWRQACPLPMAHLPLRLCPPLACTAPPAHSGCRRSTCKRLPLSCSCSAKLPKAPPGCVGAHLQSTQRRGLSGCTARRYPRPCTSHPLLASARAVLLMASPSPHYIWSGLVHQGSPRPHCVWCTRGLHGCSLKAFPGGPGQPSALSELMSATPIPLRSGQMPPCLLRPSCSNFPFVLENA